MRPIKKAARNSTFFAKKSPEMIPKLAVEIKLKSLRCPLCFAYFVPSYKNPKCPVITKCGILLCLQCLKNESSIDDKTKRSFPCKSNCADCWNEVAPAHFLFGILNEMLNCVNGIEGFLSTPIAYRAKIKRQMECEICHDGYEMKKSDKIPHPLDCGHTFCYRCCLELSKITIRPSSFFQIAAKESCNFYHSQINSFNFTSQQKLYLYTIQVVNLNLGGQKKKIYVTVKQEQKVIRKIAAMATGLGPMNFSLIVPVELTPKTTYTVEFELEENRRISHNGPALESQTVDGEKYEISFSEYGQSSSSSQGWHAFVLIVGKERFNSYFNAPKTEELLIDECVLPKDYNPKSAIINCPLCSNVSDFIPAVDQKKHCLKEFMIEFEDILQNAKMLSCDCGKSFDVDDLLTCITCKAEENNSKSLPICAKCFIANHNGHQFEPAAKQEILSMNNEMSSFLQMNLKTYEKIIPTLSEDVAELLQVIPKNCEDFEEKMQTNDSYEKAFEKVAECRELVKNYETICEDFIPHLRGLEKKLQQVVVSVEKLKTFTPESSK